MERAKERVGRGVVRVLVAALLAGAPLPAQRDRPAAQPRGETTTTLTAPTRGNVLVLLADDLGAEALALYGSSADPAPTPHLDALAASGVLFRSAWSQPVCSPTRATIQTGRYGFRNTIGHVVHTFEPDPGLPLAELTLPEMLDLGTGGAYAHAAIGKWHLGTVQVGGDLAPNLAGYAHFAGSLEGQLSSYFGWTKVVDGTRVHVTRYATSETVDDALAWIGAQSTPWLCYVAFQAPHAPFHRPPAALHTQVLPAGEPRRSCSATTGNDPRPYVKAAIEALDTEIGRLLASIPESTLARTTVIFLGDNGSDWCLPPEEMLSRAKGTLYEGGVHVPLIVAGLRVETAGECDGLVNTSDVFATVAELAGVELDEAFPGVAFDSVSLLPYLRHPSRASLRARVLAESFTPNGQGNPLPLPECPPWEVCQEDVGFGGPEVALSICGLPLYGLYGASSIPLLLTGAPPGTSATLRIGDYSPVHLPEYGATVVSAHPSTTRTYQTDAQGALRDSLFLASTDRYYQFVVVDPAQPSGHSVSNAVRIDPLWTAMRAARGPRYKLIRFHPCREELYDLAADPGERVDLLLGTLDEDAAAAYAELAPYLDAPE